MNVTCPDCGSVFRVDPAKVPEAGVRARCSVCGSVIAVAGPSAAPPRELASAPAPVVEVEPAGDPAADVSPGDAQPADVPVTPTEDGAQEVPAAVGYGAELAPSPAAPEPERLAPPAPEPAPQGRPARPFNPYLSNTPELRARRLARALVSDLVAYNPQKREEGLRDGTLRQLFREEIRKSWEEYVEQVGAQVAESTPHFQDALNDVLAGGRRVF